MPSLEYKEQDSGIFGKVSRPLIKVEVYSFTKDKWYGISDVLADTGADISILPRNLGESLIADITKGKIQEVKGIVPFSKLTVYIHNLRLRINSKEFELPVAIADSDDVLPILGRVKGLDLFNVNFNKGKKVAIEE